MTSSNPLFARSRKLQRQQTKVSYLFLLPALLFFFAFVVFPMGMGIYTSFFNYTMSDFGFIGLANYRELLNDPVFRQSVVNTLIIVVASVPLVAAFSLWVATVIYQKKPLSRSFYRGVFYLPVVMGSVPVVVVWKWVFNQYYGILNWLLQTVGILAPNARINWLGDARYAIWCILAILFTTSIGQPIVLYVASLGNVDAAQIEASEVDGASKWQTFRHVKWPSLLPTTLYVLIITTINSFQCFALIQLLTNGGPSGSTSTVMYYLYETAFKLYRYGYANAMGVILAILIALFSALQFRAMRTGD
ncbi:MAG: carbohydrate ABC transporter permease [Christensenellales bacterium]